MRLDLSTMLVLIALADGNARLQTLARSTIFSLPEPSAVSLLLMGSLGLLGFGAAGSRSRRRGSSVLKDSPRDAA